MFFGTRVPEHRALTILDHFVERSGRFLDTAHNYASWLPGGTGTRASCSSAAGSPLVDTATVAGSDVGVQVVADADLLDYLAAAEMTLLPYSPLLSGAYTRDDVVLPAAHRTADNARRLEALHAVATDTGATPNQVVLAWLRHSAPGTVVPVIAASSVEQLDENLDGFDLVLDEEHLRRLDEAPSQP